MINKDFEKKDLFKKLSSSLTFLVDDLGSYKKNMDVIHKKYIEKNLKEMTQITKILNGLIEENFSQLKIKIEEFLLNPERNIDDIMTKCVELKNQLWEL